MHAGILNWNGQEYVYTYNEKKANSILIQYEINEFVYLMFQWKDKYYARVSHLFKNHNCISL